MNLAMIVAYDQQRAIGHNGDLPWARSLPADLANFKKLTTNSSVIMGRKTFESIGSRPLPNRENIVISSTPTGVKGTLTALNIPSALSLARYPVYFIGGSMIYAEALQYVETIYATEINHSFDGADVFFPEIGREWQEVSREHHPADDSNAYDFDFVKYCKTTQK